MYLTVRTWISVAAGLIAGLACAGLVILPFWLIGWKMNHNHTALLVGQILGWVVGVPVFLIVAVVRHTRSKRKSQERAMRRRLAAANSRKRSKSN